MKEKIPVEVLGFGFPSIRACCDFMGVDHKNIGTRAKRNGRTTISQLIAECTPIAKNIIQQKKKRAIEQASINKFLYGF